MEKHGKVNECDMEEEKRKRFGIVTIH